jgi:hypothetical protein
MQASAQLPALIRPCQTLLIFLFFPDPYLFAEKLLMRLA